MDGVALQKQMRAQETSTKQHMSQMRREKATQKDELEQIRHKREQEVVKLTKEYDAKAVNAQAEMEKKLSKIRSDNETKLKLEEERFTQLLSDVKTAHDQKLGEMKVTFQTQIENQEMSQKDYLEKANHRFNEEKRKLGEEA